MRSHLVFDVLKRVASLLERYLLLWLCTSTWIAFRWPSSAPNSDWFSRSQPWLPYIIVVTMFAIGWLLPLEEVKQVFRRWPLVLGGTTIQYMSMPLLAFAVSSVFPLSDDLRLGLIMVGCVPGAMASNVLTMVARGNVSYSLSLTTAATCLSPIFVPVVLKLTMNQSLPTSMSDLVWKLCWMVVIPAVAGFCCGLACQGVRSWAEQIGKIVANLAILWIIAVVVGVNRERLSNVDHLILAAALSLNLGGYAVGLAGGRLLGLPDGMRRALTLEIGMQNAGLGTALASKLFVDQPAVMIPTALYTFGCMFTGTILARYWATQTKQIPPAS